MEENRKKQNDILQYSEKESSKLNLRVFRGLLQEIRPSFLQTEIVSKGVDLAIIRIPVELSRELHKLNKMGFDYLVADTLVYYSMGLRDYISKKQDNHDLIFLKYQPKNYQSIMDLIDQIFKNYVNHYASNPGLSVNIVDAYQEWAKNMLERNENSTDTWIIRRGEKDIAFILCASGMRETEVVLNGVVPSESGKKVYSDIIKYIQAYFGRKNFERIKISTQLSNYAAQKVWMRNGFVLDQAYYTVHIQIKK